MPDSYNISRDTHQTIETIVNRLGGGKKRGGYNPTWQARCPAHDDHTPSLSLSLGRDGIVLVKCHASCSQDQVLDAIERKTGISIRRPSSQAPIYRPAPRQTFQEGVAAEEATSKRCSAPDAETAASLLLENYISEGASLVAMHAYKTAEGEAVFYRLRLTPAKGRTFAGKSKLIRPMRRIGANQWELSAPPAPPEGRMLYGLDRLAASPDERVVVVEGEKDTDGLWDHGIPATTAGGAGSASGAYWRDLQGKDALIFPDNNEAGAKYAINVAQKLQGTARSVATVDVALLDLPDGQGALAWLDQNPQATIEDLWALPRLKPEPQPTRTKDDAWPELDLHFLENTKPSVPSLPTEAIFPPATATCVETAAEAIGAPTDYVALGLLGAIAGVSGAGVVVEATAEWREPSVLWLAAIGAPSTGKTPALSIGRDLLRAEETERRKGDDDRRRAHEAQAEAAKQTRSKWQGEVEEAVKRGAPPPPMPVAADLPGAFVATQFVIGDATLESIADVISGNPRGVVSWHDELAGWFQSFERYSNGSNRPAWLEAYSAGPAVINRKARNEPLRLPRFPLSVVGTIQPDRLRDALAGADDGLVARFLYVWPQQRDYKSLLDRRSPEPSQMLIRLRRIADVVGTADEPLVLRLDSAALTTLDEFCREHHDEASNAMGLMAGWHGKGRGTVLRLAGVLHLLECAESAGQFQMTISGPTLMKACALWSDYFRHHAAAAFAVSGLRRADQHARRVVEWLRKGGRAEVTAREVYRDGLGQGATIDDRDKVVRLLIDMGVIRPTAQSSGRGRPSARYEVNPALYAGVSANA